MKRVSLCNLMRLIVSESFLMKSDERDAQGTKRIFIDFFVYQARRNVN